MTNTIAKAKTGTYIGHQLDNGVIEFLGIPYVQAPKRWKKAEPLPASDEAFEADHYGHPCWQVVFPEEWEETPDMSEDCLALNIWTSDTDAKGKPVMVWIHGGSYYTGAAHIDCFGGVYCGDKFVESQPDIVYVNFNYRLNVFGMLDLSHLEGAEEYEDSLNLATYDQMAAIRWVKENIEAFGGDPENITVFGQSAGGGSVSTLCCIPQANEMFQKAIIQSAGLSDKTIRHQQEAKTVGMKITEKLGAKSMDDMLAVSAEKLRNAAEWYFDEAGGDNGAPFDATWGVGLLPQEPLEGLRKGSASHLAVMTGSTSGEYASWVATMTSDEIRQMAKDAMPCESAEGVSSRLSDETIDAFIANDPDRSERDALIDLHMDVLLRGIQLTMAEALVAGGSTVYDYYISCVPEGAQYKPQYCFEIPYIVGKPYNYVYLDAASGEPVQGKNPIMKLVGELQGSWAAFARSGNPNGPHLTADWTPYTMENHETLVIDYDLNLVNGVRDNDWALVAPLHHD